MDRGTALVIVATILLSISIIVTVLRLIARFWILKVSGMDDYCVMGAIITTLGMLVSINLGVHYGIGKNNIMNTIDTQKVGKLQLAIQILYIMSSGLIKISILLLYRRIFPALRRLSVLTVILVGMVAVAFIFTAVFQCEPVGRFWLRPKSAQNSCVSLLIFWCDVAVVFLISNVWITLLPFREIFSLHLSIRKRIMVFLLLGSTGICTVVSAAVRLAFVIHLYKGHDDTLDVVPIYICSVVEISTALAAASIPALRLAGMTYLDRLKSYKRRQSVESH